ncbi:MAG: hypothetical protein ACI4XL_00650 [Bacillus sp. (in: firmicutes)]
MKIWIIVLIVLFILLVVAETAVHLFLNRENQRGIKFPIKKIFRKRKKDQAVSSGSQRR